jgi:hypothetical protein
MTTMQHDTARRPWFEAPAVRDVWASLAISTIWLAVLFDAVFGPDLVSASTTSTTRVPSAIVVAVFAWLATAAVAHYAFAHRADD